MKNIGWIFGALLLVAGVGAAVWYTQKPVPPPTPTASAPEPSVAPARIVPPSALEGRPEAPPIPPAPAETTPKPNTTAAVERIDEVLRDESISHDDAARNLLAVVADDAVSDAVRLEAMQHAMNLLSDESFTAVEGLLKGKTTPPEILDTVFHEIHNRAVDVQLPAAYLLMQRSGEEVAQQARDLLGFHLEQDLGDDPAAWAEAVRAATEKAKQERAEGGL